MANVAEVRKIARTMMNDHGLHDWTLVMGRAKTYYGFCRYGAKTITLSVPLVELNPLETAVDTILHEIAHALAGHKAGHGPEWRKIALSIGCDGKRVKSDGVAPPRKYVGTCPVCDRKSYRHRRTNTACSACCDKYANGTYDPRFKIVWAENPGSVTA